jgi:hypothetical protein
MMTSGRTGHKLIIFFTIINDAPLSRWKNVFMLNPEWAFLSSLWTSSSSTRSAEWSALVPYLTSLPHDA